MEKAKNNSEVCESFCPSNEDFEGLKEKVLEVAGLS
jgi:hypothetical protein